LTLAFALITVDRRQQLRNYEARPHPAKPDAINYIDRTLNRFADSECFESRNLWTMDIVDSGSPESYAIDYGIKDFVENSHGRAEYHNGGWNRNANQNFLAAMRMASHRGADYTVLIEDDVDFIDGFVDGVADWLTDHARPEAHVYVFGAACVPGSPKNPKDREKQDGTMWETSQQDGEWTYPSSKFMGTQCIALSSYDTQAMCHWLEADKQFNKRAYGYDCEMRRWAETTFGKDTSFVCTAPSFVQHVGDESAIHLGRFHTYASFPGHEWRYKKKS
jgi:hypothetical protein